jgi:hypothetical protein
LQYLFQAVKQICGFSKLRIFQILFVSTFMCVCVCGGGGGKGAKIRNRLSAEKAKLWSDLKYNNRPNSLSSQRQDFYKCPRTAPDHHRSAFTEVNFINPKELD